MSTRFQRFEIEFGEGKCFGRWQERYFRTVALAGLQIANRFQVLVGLAVTERHGPFFALAP